MKIAYCHNSLQFDPLIRGYAFIQTYLDAAGDILFQLGSVCELTDAVDGEEIECQRTGEEPV